MAPAPFVPFEFTEPLATPRLWLRPATPDDLADVLAYQSDPEVCRYLLYEPRSRDEVADKISAQARARTLAGPGDYLEPAIVLRADPDRVVGHGYLNLASVADRSAEIGWALHRSVWGRGYATEAAAALLDLAFGPLGLHRVWAELDPRNDASVAVCRRLGMRHEATFVEHMWFKGDWADTGVYGILDREWAARTR